MCVCVCVCVCARMCVCVCVVYPHAGLLGQHLTRGGLACARDT
jgi:hypothetical protein